MSVTQAPFLLSQIWHRLASMQEATATKFHPTGTPKWHARPYGLGGDILRKKDGTGRVFSSEAAALKAARKARNTPAA